MGDDPRGPPPDDISDVALLLGRLALGVLAAVSVIAAVGRTRGWW